MAGAGDSALTEQALLSGWRRLGLEPGTRVIVHSSLSRLGRIDGGAQSVAASLLEAVGGSGTVVVPTFTPQVADPEPGSTAVPDLLLRSRRDAVPVFHAGLPSTMGALAEAVRRWPGAVRSRHPQVSVAAVGGDAARVVADQPWHFAVGPGSPFARLLDLDGHILLVGVGHHRNSFLHHAESLLPAPRLKVRRFPVLVDGERVWWETLDVADDGGRHFPVVGAEYESAHRVEATWLGDARVVLLPARAFVTFAAPRLAQLIAQDRAAPAG